MAPHDLNSSYRNTIALSCDFLNHEIHQRHELRRHVISIRAFRVVRSNSDRDLMS